MGEVGESGEVDKAARKGEGKLGVLSAPLTLLAEEDPRIPYGQATCLRFFLGFGEHYMYNTSRMMARSSAESFAPPRSVKRGCRSNSRTMDANSACQDRRMVRAVCYWSERVAIGTAGGSVEALPSAAIGEAIASQPQAHFDVF
eukprot:817484-Prorocentrum_minimum.AAC.1